MGKPEITIDDIDRAMYEELAGDSILGEITAQEVWDRMEEYALANGITLEFLSRLADRLLEAVQTMQLGGVEPLLTFTSAFKNSFLLGWIAHKVLGDGEIEADS